MAYDGLIISINSINQYLLMLQVPIEYYQRLQNKSQIKNTLIVLNIITILVLIMLLKSLYVSHIQSQNFVRKQIQFEKSTYDNIIKECGQEQYIQSKKYHECAKHHKRLMKSYAKFTQLLLQQRLKKFEEESQKACRGKAYASDQLLLSCIEKIEDRQLPKFQKDIRYLQLLRQKLLKDLLNQSYANSK